MPTDDTTVDTTTARTSTLDRRDFLSVFHKTIDDLDGLRVSDDFKMKIESKRKILNVICTLQMLHDLLNLNDIDPMNNADTVNIDMPDTVDSDSIDSNVFLKDCGCCK